MKQQKLLLIGIIIGIVLLLIAPFFGDIYGSFLGEVDRTLEHYTMLCRSAIVSIQIIGGLIIALCGLAMIVMQMKIKREIG